MPQKNVLFQFFLFAFYTIAYCSITRIIVVVVSRQERSVNQPESRLSQVDRFNSREKWALSWTPGADARSVPFRHPSEAGVRNESWDSVAVETTVTCFVSLAC